MACGCNKNKTSVSRGPAIRPGVYNRSSSNIIAPTQLRAQSVPTTPKVNEAGQNANKRKTQSMRRDAILKAFGK